MTFAEFGLHCEQASPNIPQPPVFCLRTKNAFAVIKSLLGSYWARFQIQDRIAYYQALCFTKAFTVAHLQPSDSPNGRIVYSPTESGMINVSA